MRSFQSRLSDFEARGLRVVAISVDSVEINQQHSQKMGFNFPLLSDADAAMIRRYNLLHRGGGPKGADISRPAEFLVDSRGIIRWVNLTDNIAVRVRPEQVLEAFDALRGD